jgi:phage terminase large subunit-like protein
MAWNLSTPDWADRIRTGRSLIPNLPLNDAAAARAVNIFDKLRLPDVPGKPLLRDAAGDWFRDIVRALHGSIDAETGERMIREPFLLVPKKSSKTSYGAALMLTSLLINERPKAEFLLIGPTQPISEIAYRQIEGMVDIDQKLREMIHVQSHLKKLTWRPTGATLQVKSFDPNVLTGVKPAGALMDELHVVSTNPNADRVIGQLRGGLMSQPEGFLAFITTQSERPPAGVFKAELDKARAIRDGKRDGAMLPVLYEFPDDINADPAKWGDSENWWMVTPNRGRSITIERLREDFQAAKDTSEEEFRRWASQHLNLEIGLSLRSDRWVGADYWEACGDRSVTLDALLDRCDVIVCGIDGGGLSDLLGFCAIGREKVTRRWLHFGRAWAYRSALERQKEIASKLHDLETAGDVTIVDQIGDDVEELVSIIEQIDRARLLPDENAIGVDPVGIGQVLDALSVRGINNNEKKRIVGISQGWQLGRAIKTLERHLADGSFVHGAQPLMAWCVGNAKVEPRANGILITKQASGTAKIDSLMATFNATDLMSLDPPIPGGGPSVYEERGLLTLGGSARRMDSGGGRHDETWDDFERDFV